VILKKQINIIDFLINQFNKRFSDFEMLRKDLILFENSLIVQIEEQSLDFQTELCDLQCDSSLEAIRKRSRVFQDFGCIMYISVFEFSPCLSLRIYVNALSLKCNL